MIISIANIAKEVNDAIFTIFQVTKCMIAMNMVDFLLLSILNNI
jgi:hypothetical protein